MTLRNNHRSGVLASGPAGQRAVRWAAIVFVAALIGAPATGRGDEPELPDSASFLRSEDVRETLPAVSHPFQCGESLRFNVQYGFIHAGTAWLEVPEIADWHGHRAWRLVGRAQSNGFFDKVYKVRNRVESLWDKDERFSWRYLENRHEGHFSTTDTMVYEPDSSLLRHRNGQTFEARQPVQDALSAFYLTRFRALPIGGRVTFDYHAGRKTALMEVRVLGREKVKVPAGTFNCVAIEPLLRAGGIFKHEGRLVIWLTDDERRMPVMMRSKVAIGSIRVLLAEAKTGV